MSGLERGQLQSTEERLGIQTYALCPALNQSQSLIPLATIALARFRPEAKCGKVPL